MRLLVTRPAHDAAELRAHLVAQGHEVLIEPLVEISFEDTDSIELAGVQALIATSRNGLRALANNPEFDTALAMPLFAVGPGTAATARALGMTQVIKGPATARDLIAFIVETAEVNGGPLLHLAGDVLSFDFAAELRRLGFAVLQPVVYHSIAVDRLSGSTTARLRRGEIEGVLLLSPRTAATYAELIKKYDLVEAARKPTYFCISQRTADELADLRPFALEIAQHPNLQEVLAMTSRAAPPSFGASTGR